jgi:hypothetical protein
MFRSINLNLYALNFTTLAAQAQTNYDGFISLIADYPAPKPSMPVFKSHITKLNAAIAKWGVKGNRGSHKDYLGLLAARKIVRNDLRKLVQYAQNRKPGDVESWSKLGFKSKKLKSKPAPLQMVQDFHHFISRSVPAPALKLKWKKPLDTDRRAVKYYIIQRNNKPEYPAPNNEAQIANVIGFVTRTTFIDKNPFAGPNWYWVTPVNSVGLGVTSQAVLVVSTMTR